MGRPRQGVVIEATPLEWAVLAGFFSGEGHIGLGVGPTLGHSKRNVQVIISLSQAKEAPLIWVQERFGGKVRKGQQGKGSFAAGSIRYWWHIGTREGSTQLLQGMTPYLICKQEEAQLALKLMKPGRSIESQLRLKEKIRKLRH